MTITGTIIGYTICILAALLMVLIAYWWGYVTPFDRYMRQYRKDIDEIQEVFERRHEQDLEDYYRRANKEITKK